VSADRPPRSAQLFQNSAALEFAAAATLFGNFDGVDRLIIKIIPTAVPTLVNGRDAIKHFKPSKRLDRRLLWRLMRVNIALENSVDIIV
jgi:hypothetical protein